MKKEARPTRHNAKRARPDHVAKHEIAFTGKRTLGPFEGIDYVNGCRDKVPYPSRASARSICKTMKLTTGDDVEPYQCIGGCGMWHVGHPRKDEKPEYLCLRDNCNWAGPREQLLTHTCGLP